MLDYGIQQSIAGCAYYGIKHSVVECAWLWKKNHSFLGHAGLWNKTLYCKVCAGSWKEIINNNYSYVYKTINQWIKRAKLLLKVSITECSFGTHIMLKSVVTETGLS